MNLSKNMSTKFLKVVIFFFIKFSFIGASSDVINNDYGGSRGRFPKKISQII